MSARQARAVLELSELTPAPARVIKPTEKTERHLFLDFTRGLAVLMMVQGHTVDALLGPDPRHTTGFTVWLFFRGLTACMFLLASGFAFSSASHRDQRSGWAPATRRLRRFALLFVIGYALHFPMSKWSQIAIMDAPAWKSFLAVNVLQCVAVTLAALQILRLLVGSTRRYAWTALGACVLIVAATPVVWRYGGSLGLPMTLAAYLSPSVNGSLFPLFPWSAYALLGAALGDVYTRRGIATTVFAIRLLVPAGVALLGLALLVQLAPVSFFGSTGFWVDSPGLFFMRAGIVLLLLALLAWVSHLVHRPLPPLQALARESLVIYVAHLCLVFGSPWNPGLRQFLGSSLAVPPVLAIVVIVLLAMVGVAMFWQWCKHHRPTLAQNIRVAVFASVIARML